MAKHDQRTEKLIVRDLCSTIQLSSASHFLWQKGKIMARKRYFDITLVEGVTPEIIREYKKIVRHERYIEECDRKNRTKKYGFEEEIERFLPELINQTDDILSESMIKLLYEALNELLSVDEPCYHAVVDYYFSCEKVSFSDEDMMNGFEFPGEIPLTVGLDGIIDRKVRHSDIYYYKSQNKYYSDLDRRIPDKTGIYRIDDSGVATKKYTFAPTFKANMGTYHDRVPIRGGLSTRF
ncbi:MAG: hypothetical protein NC299_14120 [Lachnospiraceae bacterium]|nr:hypothetical protein [Lachnospiraceae bacterium]